MTEDKKNQILELVFLHGSKIAEAIEALRLLKRALHSMDAGGSLRAILEDGGDPIAEMLAAEFSENMIYVPIKEAERELRNAQNAVQMFIRLFTQSCGIAKHKAVNHD